MTVELPDHSVANTQIVPQWGQRSGNFAAKFEKLALWLQMSTAELTENTEIYPRQIEWHDAKSSFQRQSHGN